MVWTYTKKITSVPGIRLNFSKLGINSILENSPSSFGLSETTNPPCSLPKIKLRPGIESNIFSSDIAKITSDGMRGIKEAILMAHDQRQDLIKETKHIEGELNTYRKKLNLSYYLIYGLLSKKYRHRMQDSITNQKLAIESLNKHIENSNVHLQITFEEELSGAFKTVVDNFKQIADCKKIWDLTAAYSIDRFTTRSSAATEVYRKDVTLKYGHIPQIKSDIPAMVWENANGADLYFYPNFIVSWNNKQEFAIIGIDEIDISFKNQRFVEEETVPSDTQIIDRTWHKVNKNGTPDQRFSHNYQIPVVLYGDIAIKTKTGLNELYEFSDPTKAEAFVQAFLEYQIQVIRLEYLPSIKA